MYRRLHAWRHRHFRGQGDAFAGNVNGAKKADPPLFCAIPISFSKGDVPSHLVFKAAFTYFSGPLRRLRTHFHPPLITRNGVRPPARAIGQPWSPQGARTRLESENTPRKSRLRPSQRLFIVVSGFLTVTCNGTSPPTGGDLSHGLHLP